jgi:protocatechuate 3,4-dioxygenase alpha subunit
VTPPYTPSQTVGPFFAIGMDWLTGDAVTDGTEGTIVLSGRVIDGAGAGVPDALVETWQVEPEAFGRAATDEHGGWSVRTVKPGRPDDRQAPHVAVQVFARGLLRQDATRVYFGDEEEANAADPALLSLPDDAARATLVATPTDDGYHLDIHLQGDHETTFFSV